MTTYCYTLYDPYRRSPYSHVSRAKSQKSSPKSEIKQPDDVNEFDPSVYFDIPDFQDYQDNNYQYRTMDVFQQQQPMVYSPVPLSFRIQQQLLPQPVYQQQMVQQKMIPIRPKSQPRTMINLQPIMYNYHFSKRCRVGTKRSNTGCYTCRLRRVKCDEANPRCKGCSGINITCEYPSIEKQRPVYMVDPAARKQMIEDIKKKRALQRVQISK
jgi:hypothetical protein